MSDTQRFPRVGRPNSVIAAKITRGFPMPPYDSSRDGWDIHVRFHVLYWMCNLSERKARRLCESHALETQGTKDDLLRRYYLHWRAVRLKIGKVHYGYDKGYNFTRTPTCPCGQRSVADVRAFKEKKEKEKEMKKLIKAKQSIRRFPRPYRFPRLAKKAAA